MKILRISFLASLFSITCFKLFSAFLPPILGGAAGLGGLAASAGKGAKDMLSRVGFFLDMTELTFKLISFFSIIILTSLLIALILKRYRLAKLRAVLRMLDRIHYELLFLNAKMVLKTDEKGWLKVQRKEDLKILEKLLNNKMFVRRIRIPVWERMIKSLKFLKDEKISIDDQILFINQMKRSVEIFLK